MTTLTTRRESLTRAVGTGPEVLALVRERADALRTLDCDAVLAPLAVRALADDTVTVEIPLVDGTDLAELERRREPLSAGECVWLGVRLCEALEAMHASGLAHGDVSPANIVVVDGSVVLVDTVAGCLDDEAGTVGFRAPERAQGATAPGDVWSVGAVLRWCASEAARVHIEAWTAPLLVHDPRARPPVAVVARALESCARATPVEVPRGADVIEAVRARAIARTERIAQGRVFRARRWALRACSAAVVAAFAAGIVVGAPRVVDAAVPGPAPSFDPPMPIPAGAAGAPDAAARDITRERAAALEESDGASLRDLIAPGPLSGSMEALAQALDEGAVDYDGLAVTVTGTSVESEAGNRATVTVAYEVSAHRVTQDGATQRVAGYHQTVAMDLSWDGRWRVERVRPA